MQSTVDQVADRIYRISTCIPDVAPGGFTFNQFLVDAEEPLLHHTGMRGVPHNWEPHVFFEQETETLFCGDLVTQLGDGPAVTDADLVGAAVAAEELFGQTSPGPRVPQTYRRLADLEPQTLAVMHGSSYDGDCPTLLRTLADVYEQQFGCGSDEAPARSLPAHAQPVG